MKRIQSNKPQHQPNFRTCTKNANKAMIKQNETSDFVTPNITLEPFHLVLYVICDKIIDAEVLVYGCSDRPWSSIVKGLLTF